MLELESYISLTEETTKASNLCDRFSERDLKKIGIEVVEGYKRDRQSRERWEKRCDAAMKLAMQVQEDKSFPWQGASNVKFPLITIAALQFHSRAYPTLISGPEVVKCRVIGEDPQGQKRARADRINTHMSWQVLEEDQAWEEQHDKGWLNLPIVGCNFTKSKFSSTVGHNVSELVLAQDLVLDYYAKSVEECSRKTHIIPLARNDVHERIHRGVYRDIGEESWFANPPAPVPKDDEHQVVKDQRSGLTPPMQADSTTPFRFLEQHVNMDLDDDGYDEPYIITVEETSSCVVRIVTRFEWQDVEWKEREGGTLIRIRATEYFTKHGFIPSPDGGIYDIGFGYLLGPLNESVDSIINQLIDAGTLSNTAGGFLGRGVKIRGGEYGFKPFQWNRVDSTGDDLHKNIMPLPVREPSNVLFQLLALLVDYTNRISGSTDLMVGENVGQNTPAETSRTLVEQGMKIYAAVFKRQWRSMKEEFKKLYILNALYMPTEQAYGSQGAKAMREDYLGNPDDVVPAADPNVTSETARLAIAQAVKQASMMTPGYDRIAVERNYLKALKVPNWQELFPGPDKVPPLPNPKLEVEQAKAQTKQQEMKAKVAMFVMQLQEEHAVNLAKIDQMKAQAAKLLAEIGEAQAAQQIKAFEAATEALQGHNKNLLEQAKMMMQFMGGEGEGGADRGGMAGMAGPSGHQGVPAGAAMGSEGPPGAMGGGGLA